MPTPTPQQRKKLRDALISAFPERPLLEQLLDFELDKKLNQITPDSNLQTVVYKLIERAQAEEWLLDLVHAARRENPGNSQLKAIALELLSPETSSIPKSSPSVSATVTQSKQEQSIEDSFNITTEFDVFLAHNNQDKPQVRKIAQELKRRSLKPWLDEEQIPPGRPFQDEIQKAILLVKSAAILISPQGLGTWQGMELRSLISRFVENNIPVIPVLLPGVDKIPDNLSFLKEFKWVTFAQGIDDENALYLLEWGITGQKPETTVKVIPQTSDDLITPKSPTKTQEILLLSDIKSPTKTQEILFLGDIKLDNGDDLSSDRSIDYTELRNFLKAGQWKEADNETYLVMLKVVGREKGSWIRDYELLNFPCTDLRTIDSLWVKYSNGRFGFSVQKKIYLEVGGVPDGIFNEEAWKKLGDRVGWRVKESWISYTEVTFDTIAPVGHLSQV